MEFSGCNNPAPPRSLNDYFTRTQEEMPELKAGVSIDPLTVPRATVHLAGSPQYLERPAPDPFVYMCLYVYSHRMPCTRNDQVYPLDAVYDTAEDVPEDVKTNKRYAGLSGFTIQEVADQIKADYGQVCYDLLYIALQCVIPPPPVLHLLE